MPSSNSIVELRTLADINALYTIDQDCTLTKELYERPLRPYRLIRLEASCQYLKKGKRCSQLHQRGYIVERKDGSQLLIGNCCALKHLGLDDEKIQGEFKQLSANEIQNIRRHRVEVLLSGRESLITRVREAGIGYRRLLEQVTDIRSELPSKIFGILIDRWKRGSHDVCWEYQQIKIGEKPNGEKYEEKHWYPHSYGQLKGLGSWLQLDEQHYPERLLVIRKDLEAIPTKSRLTNAEIEQAEAALNQVSTLSLIERELASLEKQISEFLKPSNLTLTIQLTSNQSIRSATVTAVHKLSGEYSQISPVRFIADVDLALKRQYSAGSIRIAP